MRDCALLDTLQTNPLSNGLDLQPSLFLLAGTVVDLYGAPAARQGGCMHAASDESSFARHGQDREMSTVDFIFCTAAGSPLVLPSI